VQPPNWTISNELWAFRPSLFLANSINWNSNAITKKSLVQGSPLDAANKPHKQKNNVITLYGNPYSRANRVRWALEASGAKYQEETISLNAAGTGSPRFRAINPNGLVPAIDDNGLILFESVPICLYVAKKYALDALYVDMIADEGCLLQWSVWAMTELEKHIETASLHTKWFAAAQRDASIAAKAQAEIHRCLSMLEAAIRKTGFLVAGKFTVADLIVSEILTGLVHADMTLTDFQLVKHFLQSNLSQHSAQNAFAPDIIQPYLA
jgi:glutathione S-transferase